MLKIVIYGAGRFGRSIKIQIQSDNLEEKVAWVDQENDYYQSMGYEVQPVEAIQEFEYDYIVIAVKREELASSIQKELIGKYAVCPKKIKWLRTVHILDKYWGLERQKMLKKE